MTPRFKETWDYLGHVERTSTSSLYSQKDWNQTLITMINQVSSQIFQANKSGGANKIFINEELLPLIESFEYYHPPAKTISGRYKVIIDNEIPMNKIYLSHKYEFNTMGEITILNYPTNRRIYKISVGNIDDKDVEAYVNEIANRFKRSPIVDPETGCINLKYDVKLTNQDIFISSPKYTMGVDNYTSVDTTKHKPTLWQRLKKLFKND